MDLRDWARPRTSRPQIDVVGIVEVSDRLGVKRSTVDRWRQRGVMPEPTWDLAGGPVWLWTVIEGWARETGRL